MLKMLAKDWLEQQKEKRPTLMPGSLEIFNVLVLRRTQCSRHANP